MKSSSVEGSVQSTSNQPYGNAIILFNFDNSPKLGTRSIRPGGTFIFTTDLFPLKEQLEVLGDSPFKNDTITTNTPLRLIDDIDPNNNPFVFTVVYREIPQSLFLRIVSHGVKAGELRWDDDTSKQPSWRTVLRMTGPSQRVLLIKELLPSSPFYDYQFVVYNQATKLPVPIITIPGGEEVFIDAGFYTTICIPPSQAHQTDKLPLEVGGTDAADLIITPGG